MAAGDTQLYAKVSSRLKGRSPPSLLDPLLAMGFPVHHRVSTSPLKALAATGRKTVDQASAWLHAHRQDPSLDDPIPQEYALFLCPTGPLLEKLQAFWRASQRQCARNRAHEVFPHVTLCDFFTCEDQKVELLYEALRRAGDRVVGCFPPAVPLALHSSASFLGFFIGDSPAAALLREFAAEFAAEARVLADCTVKPCTKQLHLTLAHKFYPHHQKTLEQLARAIEPGLGCQWTAALYSRDMRFVHYQTLRALFQYRPQNEDELRLSPGDLVFVDPTRQAAASEGWAFGTSARTGRRGFLPENYTERASEADGWVRHRTYTFSVATGLNSRKDGDAGGGRNGDSRPPSASRSLGSAQALQAAILRRSVLVVRHGERVDQIFGKSWLQQCSTLDGRYHRPDLNFPPSLPRRSSGVQGFENDPPLSSCGIFQARLAGDALLDSGLRVTAVFASPALRCVQTAQHILEELTPEAALQIRVEPGVSEWTEWEASGATPTFMTPEELRDASFRVDADYRPAVPSSSLAPAESYEEYVRRCTVSMGRISAACPPDGGVVLVVGHGSSLDACARPLLGLPPREYRDFAQLVRKVPALGMCFCEENQEQGRWELAEPPVAALTHGANPAFSRRSWVPGPGGEGATSVRPRP
ncbi:ubiquitin-associated and SH3 domain-containing protein A [Perognathus longimembris pacificus]|uniref:ubiquitin-associated and SH3 domain-containing protein A n=1 Tax=Perognathus longimembris pacificus TaxID=214514 RepID=UPI002019BBD5|nr:ubiquitin-associated and SH3 domain-containing protein A [Perognathus longimembris pacificus]